MRTDILTAERRRWLYIIAGAVIALMLGYNVITENVAPLWLALIAAVLWALGNITAIINTDSTGRAAIYGVAVAVVGLLVAYRILTEQQAVLWLTVAAAVLGLGTQILATVNVNDDIKGDDAFADAEPLAENEVEPEGPEPVQGVDA
jgi:peptidoglycan/LPS O-acetylase OafA/YrhL